MATTTPSGWTRVPTTGDEPDVPADMLRLAVDLEARIVPLNRARVDPVELELSANSNNPIPSAAWTKLALWNTIAYDGRAGSTSLAQSASGVTIGLSGRYYVEGGFNFAGGVGTCRRGMGFGLTTAAAPILKTQRMDWFQTGFIHYLHSSATVSLTAGDVVTIWAYQQSGVEVNAGGATLIVRRLRVGDP